MKKYETWLAVFAGYTLKMIRDFELKQLIRFKLVFIELLKHLENHFHLYSNDHLQKKYFTEFRYQF